MDKSHTVIVEALNALMSNELKFKVAEYIGKNPKSISFLWSIIEKEPYPINARAAWIFEYICTTNNSIFTLYLEKIATLFPSIENDSVMRIMAKLLMLKPIPESEEGDVLNAAFDRLANKNLPIAVRVNCMQIVYNLSEKYPELQNELRGIIENEIEFGKPAFKNRGGKILAKLNQL